MPLPDKDWIEKTKKEVASFLGFDGEIEIDAYPYMLCDVGYKLQTDLSKLEISIYSARFPSTWYRWKDDLLREIKEKVDLYKLRKLENEGVCGE
jgi:hypothetical protein